MPSCGAKAMPMLVPMMIRCPATSNGVSNSSSSRFARPMASVGRSIGDCTTANSSPPSRATVSVSRVCRSSLSATAFSRASPTRMAEGIVHRLELVEVQAMQRQPLAAPRVRQGVLQLVAEQQTVRQIGQHIVVAR